MTSAGTTVNSHMAATCVAGTSLASVNTALDQTVDIYGSFTTSGQLQIHYGWIEVIG